MSALRTAVADFWRGFGPEEVPVRFPELVAQVELEFVADVRDAELVLTSTFQGGERSTRSRDPLAGTGHDAVRLFYTAENVRPDFSVCDFALSFCRDLVDDRHLRLPNSVGALAVCGFPADVLLYCPQDPGALRRAKSRFCAYVQGNRVPFREAFVERLSRYKRVDCAGPSLNNTGHVVDRGGKFELYRECKFAVTFENESSVGYTTEKLPDALVSGCVPIYWGDPTVALDFDPRSFVRVRDAADVEDAVERIVALDRDDAAYDAMLAAPRHPGGVAPDGSDPTPRPEFYRRVVTAARAGGGGGAGAGARAGEDAGAGAGAVHA